MGLIWGPIFTMKLKPGQHLHTPLSVFLLPLFLVAGAVFVTIRYARERRKDR
jgi:hypothetical protein